MSSRWARWGLWATGVTGVQEGKGRGSRGESTG